MMNYVAIDVQHQLPDVHIGYQFCYGRSETYFLSGTTAITELVTTVFTIGMHMYIYITIHEQNT